MQPDADAHKQLVDADVRARSVQFEYFQSPFNNVLDETLVQALSISVYYTRAVVTLSSTGRVQLWFVRAGTDRPALIRQIVHSPDITCIAVRPQPELAALSQRDAERRDELFKAASRARSAFENTLRFQDDVDNVAGREAQRKAEVEAYEAMLKADADASVYYAKSAEIVVGFEGGYVQRWALREHAALGARVFNDGPRRRSQAANARTLEWVSDIHFRLAENDDDNAVSALNFVSPSVLVASQSNGAQTLLEIRSIEADLHGKLVRRGVFVVAGCNDVVASRAPSNDGEAVTLPLWACAAQRSVSIFRLERSSKLNDFYKDGPTRASDRVDIDLSADADVAVIHRLAFNGTTLAVLVSAAVNGAADSKQQRILLYKIGGSDSTTANDELQATEIKPLRVVTLGNGQPVLSAPPTPARMTPEHISPNVLMAFKPLHEDALGRSDEDYFLYDRNIQSAQAKTPAWRLCVHYAARQCSPENTPASFVRAPKHDEGLPSNWPASSAAFIHSPSTADDEPLFDLLVSRREWLSSHFVNALRVVDDLRADIKRKADCRAAAAAIGGGAVAAN